MFSSVSLFLFRFSLRPRYFLEQDIKLLQVTQFTIIKTKVRYMVQQNFLCKRQRISCKKKFLRMRDMRGPLDDLREIVILANILLLWRFF